MMSRTILHLALCMVLAPALVTAAGLGSTLKGAPFQYFTDADYESYFDAARKASAGPIGQRLEWSNPKSGARGTMTATRDFRAHGTDCRELRGENTAKNRTEPFRIAMCKATDGTWRLAPIEPSAPPGSAPKPPGPQTDAPPK